MGQCYHLLLFEVKASYSFLGKWIKRSKKPETITSFSYEHWK